LKLNSLTRTLSEAAPDAEFSLCIMYRVVSTCIDHQGRYVTESGPWFSDARQARYWADLLRQSGYKVHIESQDGRLPEQQAGDAQLLEALSSMA